MLLNFEYIMSLLSNMWEYFLLLIINWTRSSFVENEFFHVTSPIWYLTKSLKTLNEYNEAFPFHFHDNTMYA